MQGSNRTCPLPASSLWRQLRWRKSRIFMSPLPPRCRCLGHGPGRDCCSPPVAAVPDLHGHAEMLRRYLFVLGAQADRLDDLVPEVFAVALKKEL
jgi:hypothetical protein